MKNVSRLLAVTAILASPALGLLARAQEGGGGKAGGQPQRPDLVDMTFTGTITKDEMTGKEGQTMFRYILKDALGNTVMLGGKDGVQRGAKRAGVKGEAVNLDDYVNKEVTVTGKGFAVTQKNGGTLTRMAVITRIGAAPPVM